jgi:hypothetical protein
MALSVFDNMDLGQEVTKATSAGVTLDRSTENLIDFNGGGVRATAPPPKATRKATRSLGGSFGNQSFKA